MRYRWILPLLIFAAGLARSAQAVVLFDKRQAAAAPRVAAGSGLCGSITHFTAAQPLASAAEALAILNQPPASPAERTTRLFANLNLRNSQQSAGADFSGAAFPDELFPYSQGAAMPPGNDTNFALRLRGYFNVPAKLTGRLISFALNCDDFCSLRVGTTDLMPVANERVSARIIKQVMFQDAGLYPIEIIYFQNGSAAYLEWSRSDTAVAECPQDLCQVPLTDSSYGGQFQPLAKAELYSAVAGENPVCQECGAPGLDCTPGSYCSDGLCQPCNVVAHCGAGCMQCPATAQVCKAGQCAECIGDCDCAGGLLCDTVNGRCIAAAPCSRNDMCPSAMICNRDTGRCQNPPTPCTADSMCPVCQTCDTTNKICQRPTGMCNSGSDCQTGYYCDSGDHLCKPRLQNHYVGGLSCHLAAAVDLGAHGSAAPLGVLGGLALAALARHLRQRRRARGAA